MKIERLDLLDEIEASIGQRISLDILARTNLGTGKNGHGLEAIKLYKDGNWKKLEEYCLNDVKITKELYELAKRKGYLVMPERNSGNLLKIPLQFQDLVFHPTLF
jgi:DEAD/DEAH box helicase domain-containing protein